MVEEKRNGLEFWHENTYICREMHFHSILCLFGMERVDLVNRNYRETKFLPVPSIFLGVTLVHINDHILVERIK